MNVDNIRRFMEALPDASLLINYQGNILAANEYALSKLQYSEEQILQLTVEDLLPERFRQNHKPLRQSFIMGAKQRPMSGDTTKYFPTRLADNSEIMTEISIGHLSSDSEEKQFLLVILIDRTDKVKLEEALKQRANIDQLTQVYSRAYALELMEKAAQHSHHAQRNLSVIYFDADHFKSINDQYGHYIGDLVLRQIGDVCKNQLRSQDIFGRLGGEEFVVALPETDAETATKVAQRLRGAIKSIQIPAKNELLSVTASFGVAILQVDEDGIAEVLKRADHALYQAKIAGRDRVICDETNVQFKPQIQTS
ncbi:diguanylate cyclase [Vibrio sp.]|uniref:GGDEF domain-containing protein n=1 Tax=Vibrio sp. TaxID=678 RepID=UPI003D12802F